MSAKLLGEFAAAMGERLDANSHKSGWWRESPRWLLNRLKQEVRELERAIKRKQPSERIRHEAADVGNFAAMVADVYADEWEANHGAGALPQPGETADFPQPEKGKR